MGADNKVYKIPYNKPFIAGSELEYIRQAVVDRHQISGDGYFTGKCQEWLEERLGSAKALLTTSCTTALEMAAILSDIRPGDEVIMPSFTFVSTANAFVRCGARPVFVDIRPDTLNIDEELLEEAVTARTKAIVPVHYAGVPCEMRAIMEIAERRGLIVIEDAAQALLSEYEGKKLGSIGHFGALSFHETKNIISGEGGALLVNDDGLVERAEIVWEKGTDRKRFYRGEVDKYSWVDIGSSFLPSEIIAAFLWGQLESAEAIIENRREIFVTYYNLLKPLEEAGKLRLPHILSFDAGNGHIFFIIANTPGERSELLMFLRERGINAIFHYVPLHSSSAGRKFGRMHGLLTNTDSLTSRILRLPLYYGMAFKDIEYVANNVSAFYQ